MPPRVRACADDMFEPMWLPDSNFEVPNVTVQVRRSVAKSVRVAHGCNSICNMMIVSLFQVSNASQHQCIVITSILRKDSTLSLEPGFDETTAKEGERE